jgi:hypothetical protein
MKPSDNFNEVNVQDLFVSLSEEQESNVIAGVFGFESLSPYLNSAVIQLGQTMVPIIKDFFGGTVGAIKS